VQRGAGGRLLLVLDRERKEMGIESENTIFPRKIVKDLHVFSSRIQNGIG